MCSESYNRRSPPTDTRAVQDERGGRGGVGVKVATDLVCDRHGDQMGRLVRLGK